MSENNSIAHQRAREIVEDWLVAIRPAVSITVEHTPYLIEAISTTIEAEREACAKVAEDYKSGDSIANPSDIYRRIAAAIRQRKGTRHE